MAVVFGVHGVGYSAFMTETNGKLELGVVHQVTDTKLEKKGNGDGDGNETRRERTEHGGIHDMEKSHDTTGTDGSMTGTNGSTTGNVHGHDPVSSTETDIGIVGDGDNTASSTKGTLRRTHTDTRKETNSRKHDHILEVGGY